MRSAINANNRGYRRGAVMGLTLAEAFVLIAFALLMLLALWHFQVQERVERFSRLESLSEAEVIAARELAAAGQLVAAEAVLADGVDLAEIVGQLELMGAATLSPSGVAAAVVLESEGQLEAASRLVADGLDLTQGAGLPDEADLWRLIDKDELVRVLTSVADLPEDLQRDLADMVEIADPQVLAQMIEETRRYNSSQAADDPLTAIGAIFDRDQARRDETVRLLRESLGEQLSQLPGATIRGDGTIVLPESVAFARGSALISPELRNYLGASCEPWLRTLMDSPAPVAGASIEGHTDSSWFGVDPATAYLNNLALSQARSAAVLEECLRNISDETVRDWAQRHLVSIAYSSARLMRLPDGAEDQVASRRVEFSIGFDSAPVLEELEELTADADAQISSVSTGLPPGAATIIGTVNHIRDGDTFVVELEDASRLEVPIRLSGVNCEERGSTSGDRATEFLTSVILGHEVQCNLDGSRTGDRYAGYCALPSLGDVGELLISQGYCGRCSAFDPNSRYLVAEQTAGPWRGDVPAYCVSQ